MRNINILIILLECRFAFRKTVDINIVNCPWKQWRCEICGPVADQPLIKNICWGMVRERGWVPLCCFTWSECSANRAASLSLSLSDSCQGYAFSLSYQGYAFIVLEGMFLSRYKKKLILNICWFSYLRQIKFLRNLSCF